MRPFPGTCWLLLWLPPLAVPSGGAARGEEEEAAAAAAALSGNRGHGRRARARSLAPRLSSPAFPRPVSLFPSVSFTALRLRFRGWRPSSLRPCCQAPGVGCFTLLGGLLLPRAQPARGPGPVSLPASLGFPGFCGHLDAIILGLEATGPVLSFYRSSN